MPGQDANTAPCFCQPAHQFAPEVTRPAGNQDHARTASRTAESMSASPLSTGSR